MLRQYVYMPFFALCYTLWLAFGWSVWTAVRLLHLPQVRHYGVTWREEAADA